MPKAFARLTLSDYLDQVERTPRAWKMRIHRITARDVIDDWAASRLADRKHSCNELDEQIKAAKALADGLGYSSLVRFD